MKTHSRWRVWIAPVLIFLMGAGYLLSQRATAPQGRGGRGRQGAGAVPVAVAEVNKGNMGEYIYGLGTVTSVYTVAVTSRVAGELVDLHYKEGQLVKKGDLLAVIDPRPYQATYIQAQGQLQRDQALLANAKTDLQRYQMAYSEHAIPEQTVVTQQSTINQVEGTVKVDQGTLDAAKVNLDYTRITSPIDGRVGLRGVDLGNVVQANGTTPLVTITQIQPITVIFTMAENYVDEVYNEMRKGHKLRVDALNRDDQSELAQGSVLALDSQIDTTTGTVRVRAIFANKNNRLFPNEFVNTRLLVRTLMGVNIIPNAAIQRNNEVAFVYVVNPDSTVKSQNVTVATTDGVYSAVTGVAPGQRLVTDGFDKLQDGTKITVRAQYTPSGETPTSPGNKPQPVANQATQNMQAPRQGAANKNLHTAQQNPQPGGKK